MKKRTFVFLTALLLAFCMLTMVACGDKSDEANNDGGTTNNDSGNNSQAGDSGALFPDGASIEEVISILESGEVKITSCKWEGYDIGNVKKPEYEIGFSNNKFIYHMKAYGFIEGFFVCDFNALFIGQIIRPVNEMGQVTDMRGEPIGIVTDESVGWTDGLAVQIDDEEEFISEMTREMSETDVAMRKINDAVISLIKEQKGLKEGAFSCKDNILIFDKDEIYSNEEEGQTSTSGLQNIKKIYDFNVPIELPKIIEDKIAKLIEKEKESQGK